MSIQDLTYFQTIDAEKAMSKAEDYRAKLISELTDLYVATKGTEHAEALNTALESLEALEDVLNDVWDEIEAQQNALEDANSGLVLAAY
jgi:hypothetical protein